HRRVDALGGRGRGRGRGRARGRGGDRGRGRGRDRGGDRGRGRGRVGIGVVVRFFAGGRRRGDEPGLVFFSILEREHAAVDGGAVPRGVPVFVRHRRGQVG